ncbi:hypothetical protein SDC9_210832 [bioreactor metagenome]|uniref:Uncharacterized protein n=1 Tax=bioreactor metagenome TaxID=1076179 RepID=A0A645JHA7_9ZZZZ
MFLAIVGQRHHEHLAGLSHPLDLELHERVLTLTKRLRRRHPLLFDQGVNAFAQLTIGDPHEAPGLHVTHARRLVRCPQQALQQGWINRVRPKMAHVSALCNCAINR